MERIDFADQITKNRRTTWLLLFASFVLLGVVASAVAYLLGGGWVGIGFGIAAAFALTWMSYLQSDKLALAATRARPAPIEQFLQLHNVVEAMAVAAGIPKPAVYVVEDPAPNAFATGKDPGHAAVAVTTGLLAKMNRDELEGVLAHEMSHVRNYDIRVMTVAVATAGSIAVITDIFWRMMFWGAVAGGGRRRSNDNDNGGNVLTIIALLVVVVLAPLAAVLLKAAISRQREELADASAVALTRYPTGLRRALEKLDADSAVVAHTSHATAHLWIEQPTERKEDGREAKFNRMFDTHPPLRERIDVLRAMEGLPAYTEPDPAIVADLERRRLQPDPEMPPAPGGGYGGTAPGGGYGGPSAASTMPGLAHLGEQHPAAATGPATPVAGPGWYPDPAGQAGLLRYWDGQRWTKDTAAG